MESRLLTGVEPTVLEADPGGQLEPLREERLHVAHRGPEVALLEPAGHADDLPQVLAASLDRYRACAETGEGLERREPPLRDEREAVHGRQRGPELLGVAEAKRDGSVSLEHLSDDGPGDCRIEPLLYGCRIESDQLGPPLIDLDAVGRADLGDPVEGVHDSGGGADRGIGGMRRPLEDGMIRPEELHLDGFRVPAQVADHVLQDLHEFHPEAGESIVNLPAHGGDHLRAGSPGTILQPHGVVPAVRLGQKEAELRAGSPRERPDLGGAGEDGVHAREHAKSLVE